MLKRFSASSNHIIYLRFMFFLNFYLLVPILESVVVVKFAHLNLLPDGGQPAIGEGDDITKLYWFLVQGWRNVHKNFLFLRTNYFGTLKARKCCRPAVLGMLARGVNTVKARHGIALWEGMCLL